VRAVLADTSVWVDHFRRPNAMLADLLLHDRVVMHPLILGEIACGTPPERQRTLADLGQLEQTRQASVPEAMALIERERLFGSGCGLVDVLLLASVLLTPGVGLWTLDKRLGTLAERFGVRYRPALH
jgi:predicted nucleic acid-binding protein